MLASGLYIEELVKQRVNVPQVVDFDPSTLVVASDGKRISVFSPDNGCACLLSREEAEVLRTSSDDPLLYVLGYLLTIKVPLPLPRFRLVVMPVLYGGCKANCQYCYIPAGVARRGVTDIGMISRLVENEYLGGDVHIDFSGEVGFAISPISAIVRRLRSWLGDRVSFSAQLSEPDQNIETIDYLGRQGFSFGVSFDGTPHLHEFHRGQSSEPTVRLLSTLVKTDFPYLVRCTVSRLSIKEAQPMWTFLESLGIRSIIMNKLRPPAEPTSLEGPSESEWLTFCDEWLDRSLRNYFPQLCDDTVLKWFHRIGSSATGWSNLCSTAWCESHCRVRVLTQASDDIQCARFWARFPAPDLRFSGSLSCSNCICRYHCGGGCRIESQALAEHAVACSHKKWVMRRLLSAMLTLPISELKQMGFETVSISFFTKRDFSLRPIHDSTIRELSGLFGPRNYGLHGEKRNN